MGPTLELAASRERNTIGHVLNTVMKVLSHVKLNRKVYHRVNIFVSYFIT